MAYFWLIVVHACTWIVCNTQAIAPTNRTVAFQVIGAGMGRTGTKSLHSALEVLGISPIHDWKNTQADTGPNSMWAQQIMLERQVKNKITSHEIWHSREQWDQILAPYAGVVDSPANLFVAELSRAYPEAKVVLTVRDSVQTWAASYNRTICDRNRRLQGSRSFRLMTYLKSLLWYDSYYSEVSRALQVRDPHALQPNVSEYLEHVKHVLRSVPSGRLLEFNVKQGWEPLCQFLGKDIPSTPFPHDHDNNYWQKRTDSLLDQAEREMQTLLIVLGTLLGVSGGIFYWLRLRSV